MPKERKTGYLINILPLKIAIAILVFLTFTSTTITQFVISCSGLLFTIFWLIQTKKTYTFTEEETKMRFAKRRERAEFWDSFRNTAKEKRQRL